ncbi:MAG: site-specific integrase [Acidobacteriota bacterium]
MSVRKRGRYYHYDITINTRRYRGPLPTARTKRDAAEQEDRIRISIHDGTFDRPRAKTIGEFIDEVGRQWCRTNHRGKPETDEYCFKVMREHFKDKPLIDISPIDVERFKRERMATPIHGGKARSPTTVNYEINALSRMMALAVEYGLARENPCSRVRRLNNGSQRNRYATEEEERVILADLRLRKHRILPVVLLALNTGMRRGEIVSLRWSQVDLQRNLIYLTKTKSGKPRDVPINQVARVVLLDLAGKRGGGRPDSETLFDFTEHQATDAWRECCKRVKVAGLRFHDLRHTFATRLADTGCDPFTIMELLGHTDPKMTKRYTHALDSNKRRAVALLAGRSEKAEEPSQIRHIQSGRG